MSEPLTAVTLTAPAPSHLPATLRTFVPLIVGVLLGWPATQALGVDEGLLTAAVTALLTAAYYSAVRLIESRWPAAGWALGYASQPAYLPASAPSGTVLVSARKVEDVRLR